MNKIKVYLGGAMEGCTDDEMHLWRNYFKLVFVDQIDFFDPTVRKININCFSDAEIVEQDKLDILNSDILLVNYTPKKSMIGSSMEVMYAFEHNKPIFVLWGRKEEVSPWITFHATYIAKTLPEMIGELHDEYIRSN